MPRSTSSHHTKGKSDHGHGFSSAWSMKSNSRRGSKVASEDGAANDNATTPSKGLDRHARMKLAMAETLENDDAPPASSRPQTGAESPRTKIAAEQAQAKAQAAIAQAQVAAARGDIDAARRQKETPGEGSLTFDAFGTSGDVVLADGVPATPTLVSSENSAANARPDLHTDGHQPPRSDSLPAFHARGVTEAAQSSKRAASLMVPGDDPAAHGHSRSRTDHAMHPSQSTSALLSPRQRTHSDASSADGGRHSPTKFRKGKPGAGGIASALAASGAGMAGMGMVNPNAVAEAHARAAAAAQAAAAQARVKTPSGTKVEKDYVGSSQGGVYRDPTSGIVTEKNEHGHEVRYHPGRSSSSQGGSIHLARASSHTSLAESDGSEASGLAAAASFPAMQAGALLTPALSHTANTHGAPTIALDSSHAESSRRGQDGPGRDAAGTTAAAAGADGNEPASSSTAGGEGGRGWPSDVGAQITGFAVASSKRNADFHALFTTVPDDDYLIEDYGCALVREVFIQGRLYVSENHICFYANIFGWVTNIVVPFSETVSIEKRMTALIIPNAIQIATLHAKHTFSSFITRDATYDLMANIWKLSHPDVPVGGADIVMDAGAAAAAGSAGEDESDDEQEQKPSKPSKRGILRKKLKGSHKKGDDGVSSPTKGAGGKANGSAKGGKDEGVNGGEKGTSSKDQSGGSGGGKARKSKHPATSCPCEGEKKHLSTVALDTTYPATPEKVYGLLFGGKGGSAGEDGGSDDFMRRFWTEDQKLFDLEVSAWKSSTPKSRDLSYIKPLAGGFGPKQTKCVITDEEVHVDFDKYATVLTTTRTPDVPSGGSFCVRTRTCITWAGKGTNDAKVYVTCATEWSGRSMLRSVIDKASIDGQKGYYTALDAELRKYIKAHAKEMRDGEEDDDSDDEDEDEDDDEDEEEAKDGASTAATPAETQPASSSGVLAALGPVGDILSPIVDMVQPFLPASGASAGSLALLSLVGLLVLSNIWAWGRAPQRDPLDPHRLRRPVAASSSKSSSSHHHNAIESAEAVASAVRDVLHEYLGPMHVRGRGPFGHSHDVGVDPWADVEGIGKLLDEAEERLGLLRRMWEEARVRQQGSQQQKKIEGDKKGKASARGGGEL